jgi:hypothetical protein
MGDGWYGGNLSVLVLGLIFGAYKEMLTNNREIGTVLGWEEEYSLEVSRPRRASLLLLSI